MLTLLKQNMNRSSNDTLRKIEQLEEIQNWFHFFYIVFLGCSFFQIIQIQNYLIMFKVMFYFITSQSLLSIDTMYILNMWIFFTYSVCLHFTFILINWSISIPLFVLSKFEACLHIWDLKITGRGKVINRMPFRSAVFSKSGVTSETVRGHISPPCWPLRTAEKTVFYHTAYNTGLMEF